MCAFSFLLTVFVLCPIALMGQTPATENNGTSIASTEEITTIKSDDESSSLDTSEVFTSSVTEATSTLPSTNELVDVTTSIKDVWKDLTVKQIKKNVTKKSNKLEMKLSKYSEAGQIEINTISYVYCLLTVVVFRFFF